MKFRRAGHGPRREGNLRTRSILKNKWFVLPSIVLAAVMIAMIVGIYFAAQAIGIHENRLVFSFLLGAGLVSIPWALWTVGLTMGGGASWLAGAAAEEWTGRELARLGDGWHVAHNVPFDVSWEGWKSMVDVDHIAIGPYGVLVVETKWTTARVDLDSLRVPRLILDAVRQASDNAGRVRALLERDVGSVPIIPIVVLWGSGIRASTGKPRDVEGVRVVRGKDASSWRPLIQTAPNRIDAEIIESAVNRVLRHTKAHLRSRPKRNS